MKSITERCWKISGSGSIIAKLVEISCKAKSNWITLFVGLWSGKMLGDVDRHEKNVRPSNAPIAAVFLLLFATAMSSPQPAFAKGFIIRNVLTLCLTAHSDPAFIHDKLISLGWKDIGQPDYDYARATLALAYIASTSSVAEGPFSPLTWLADWQAATKDAEQYLAVSTNNKVRNLIHADTLAVMQVFVSVEEDVGVNCILAVPESKEPSLISYDALQPPPPPSAFNVKAERTIFTDTWLNYVSLSVSVNTQTVESGLDIETNIEAVFRTFYKYPASAVSP
jgi:hypothetical protein